MRLIMMKNFILFGVFTLSCELLLANGVIAYPGPDLRMADELHPGCPKVDKGTATLLPHESDCTGYYMCQSGVGILKYCPHDLHFNPTKKVCDFPDRAGCTTAEKELFLSAGFPHSDCPPENLDEVTLLPHESDCTKFYMCDNGIAHEKTCMYDLHFNAKENVCDYPEDAGCEPTEKEEVFHSVGFPHSDCPSTNPKDAVILPHESDCTKFYICNSGHAYEKTCQFGLHFNPKFQVCDYPQNAKCAPTFSQKDDDKQPKCPKTNKPTVTLLPHETDCTLYYICESGEPILRDCPDDLHFNPPKKVCDFPDRAGCKKGELHVQLAPPEATGSPSPFCPLINGGNPIFFGHPTNCSIYYMCGNGLAYEFTCPSGLHFNVRQNVCDYPWRANCRSKGY